MTGLPAIIFGMASIIAVAVLLIKQYETRLVLLSSGLIMGLVALKPFFPLEAFTTNMVQSSTLQNICSVIGFAFVMSYTQCDKHLIHFLARSLTRFSFLLVPGAAVITFIINISLTSAAGVAAAVGAVLIPLLMALGVAPAMAASAIMLGTFGSVISPGYSQTAVIDGITNAGVMNIVGTFLSPTLISLAIGVVCLFVIARLLKEDRGYVAEGQNLAEHDADFQVNPFYALLPLLPVITLVVLAQPGVRAMLPWAKELRVAHAMFLGAIVCIAVTRTSPTKATKEFFRGMGDGYGNIVGIIIAAGVFVGGLQALGVIEACIAQLKDSQSGAGLAAAFGPFLFSALSGSGEAASLAFQNSVTIHAEALGYNNVDLGCLAALTGSLGRSMSPIAGATIICASLARINPLDVAKRNGPGMFAATVASYVLLA